MGRLHDRMDRELRIRGYAENTRRCYIEKMKSSCSKTRTMDQAASR